MPETEAAEKPLRLADLVWWRRWLAEPAVFWLEWVLPRDRRFHLTLDPADGWTLSDEVLDLAGERRKRRQDVRND